MYVAIEKNPKRRRRKWPWVLLILFIIFNLPLAILYFMLYDGGMPEKSALTARSTDRIFSGVKEFFSVSAFSRKHKI